MDSIRAKHSEIVGKSQSRTAVLEVLIKSNALNRTGNVDYNKFGKLDGIGFEKVSVKFVDSFIFCVLVPDYNTEKKMKIRRNNFIGSQNRRISELLRVNGFEKCTVKGISFLEVKVLKEEMLNNMPDRNSNQEAEIYFEQVFKIACANVDYSKVMDFLRKADYNGYGFYLKDVDITLDYSGSFDKYKVIDHLTSFEDFREQGSINNGENYPRTIVDNDAMVGKNCLTWMENVDGITTRQKIYNKFVQMLECKSVRSTVGSHWKDWVCQKGTMLATARDQAKERGLTRAEVTIYIQDNKIPDDEFIDHVLEKIVKYIPKDIVYSTCYADTWKSYCDTFKHSLVCIDRTKNIGIIVYSYNQTTGNISGQVIEEWAEREKWCLDKLTLNGNLPLDIIEVAEVARVFENSKKDILLDIFGNRYHKINKDKSTRFTTRLVSKHGIFSSNPESYQGENIKLLENAGLLEHENCIPFLSKSRHSNKSKADAELRKWETLHVNILNRKEDKKCQQASLTKQMEEEILRMEEQTKPLFIELKQEKEKLDWKNECKHYFHGETIPLKNLSQGIYVLNVAKKVNNSKFAEQYMLSLGEKDKRTIVWSNKYISNKLQEAQDLKLLDVDGIYLSLRNKKLGSLRITGHGNNNVLGRTTIYCQMTFNPREEICGTQIKKASEDIGKNTHIILRENLANYSTQIKKANEDIVKNKHIIPRENLLNYREYPNLISFPVDTVCNVDGWGYIEHYGRERLVVSVDGKVFQAGKHLEENVNQLKHMCKIKIEKVRTDKNGNVKYVICSVYEKGDWTAVIKYQNVPLLPQKAMDGETCVLDVRTVEVRGQKRKLLLTDRGDGPVVYKLKKSKLEESIKVGFV